MVQKIKHYWINRDTGEWAIDTSFGITIPNIKGLEIQHNFLTDNNIPYCLSFVPEYFEYNITVSSDQLQDYQNNTNISIIECSERVVEVPIFMPGNALESREKRTETVYDLIYREPYTVEESDGLKILTEDEWNFELLSFDKKQEEKRYNILREIRNKILQLTDWIVIKSQEEKTDLSLDFKTWRKDLRDIPNSSSFPIQFPQLPQSLENNQEIKILYERFNEIRSISMINDPLPPILHDPLPPYNHRGVLSGRNG